MKKTLMVLSLTLCAAFAFAQTKQVAVSKNSNQAVAVSKAGQTDYKASIFTKDDENVIATFEFAGDNDGYTASKINERVTIDGVEYSANGQGTDFAQWRRIKSCEDPSLSNSSMYPCSYDYELSDWVIIADTGLSTSMNGFMLMSMQDQIQAWGGNGDRGVFHAQFTLDPVNTTEAGIVDVRMYQYYRCFNADQCFIDYSTDGNTWHAMEINKRDIDVAVNNSRRGIFTFTLPAATAHQANLRLRIRWYAAQNGGGAYGYLWSVDDISVIAGSANRMKLAGDNYLEGAYQILPQGFSLPVTWFTYATNNGSIRQDNVMVNLYTMAPDSARIARTNNQNIVADPTRQVVIATDGIGWMPYSYDSIAYAGWHGYSTLYNSEDVRNTNTGLPTTSEGWNRVVAEVVTDSLAARRGDTIPYLVNALDESNIAVWGYDNGILTTHQQFTEGYEITEEGTYLTNEGNWYDAGYGVSLRYTVGDSVPENWVLRGIELVASPTPGAASAGKRISASVYQDYYEGNSVYFMGVNTGANIYEVQASDLTDSAMIADNGGYMEYGDYKTIRIMFPEQPALEPFAQYRLGYNLEDAGFFSVANMQASYYRVPTADGTKDSAVYFRDDPELEKYSHTFTCANLATGANSRYSLYVEDRETGFFGSSADAVPMIRALVGPAMEVERVAISATCQSDEDGLMGAILWYGDTICDAPAMVAKGSSPTISIYPTDNYKIDHVYVDGEEVEPYDEDEETGDYALQVRDRSDEWKNPAMFYTFQTPVTEEHTISAEFSWAPVGIDPVAANVYMTLQPNPATSQVRLNIEGVEGMVNCSIIDMSGRVVYNQMINAENAQVINLSNMAKGAYFVRIVNDEFSKVEKLIVR